MSDEMPVLAPNATVVNNIDRDPPTVKPEYAFPIPGGDGHVLVRQGYSLETIDAAQAGMATHRFATVGDLARYLIRNHGEDASATDIIVEQSKVMVYIDPGHDEPQILTASLDDHPCWEAWMELTDCRVSQRDLIQHCRAWRETIVNPEALMAALGTIQVVGGSKVTSQMDETGAMRLVSAEDSKDLSVRIPPTIEFLSPVYDSIEKEEGGQAKYLCELMLSVDTEPPVDFSFKFPRHELIVRQARQDAGAYLQRLLGDAWLVSVGGASHSTRAAGASTR